MLSPKPAKQAQTKQSASDLELFSGFCRGQRSPVVNEQR
jgi:hypothetical protein